MAIPALRRPTSTLLVACALLGSLLLAPSAPAADATAAKTLGNLYEVARLMDAAVLDLNMLIGEDQSPIYKGRLEATLKKLGEAQTTSAASLKASGISAQSTQDIESGVAAFGKLVAQNRKSILTTGATEAAVVDEMMQDRADARKAIDAVYRDLEKKAGFVNSPLSEARELALLLEQMASLYVESAAASYGVSNREHSEATIDSLARGFSTRLTALAARAKGEESSKLVHDIESKWRFIEKSMINYQEKTVPFLVDRYTQVIVTDLLKLADALERGV